MDVNANPQWWKNIEDTKLKENDESNEDLMSTWKGSAKGHGVPEFGWRIALSHKFKEHPKAWSFPPLTQIPSLVGLAVRYLQFYKQLHHKNKRPCMDFFNQIPLRQIYGVPLGGIGAGSINRGWHGGFCKWQMKPGLYTYDCPLADQFIVSIRRNDKTVLQQVLNARPPSSSHPLSSWQWQSRDSHSFYHGLYPRAWTVYDLKEHDVVLTCRQVSPVFPHNYKDTSLPSAVFVWTIENNSDDDLEVTITMSMENGTGNASERKSTQGLWNSSFESRDHPTPVKGVIMRNTTYPHMPYTFAVAATEKDTNTVSHCTSFNPSKDGSPVWKPLLSTGKLESTTDKSHVTSRNEPIACAVASTCTVAKKGRSEAEFCLTWDMPQVHFGDSRRFYKRRYTRWFGSDGKAGPKLASYSLNNYRAWEEKIEEWQTPVLSNSVIPAWYKSALFNELYYVTDGGTVWLESECVAENGAPSDQLQNGGAKTNSVDEIGNVTLEEEIRNNKHMLEYGRFAYLEGQEYKMYNTYDVHFYASIALIHLWPQLEISLQYDIAASILHTNLEERKYLMDGVWGPVKTPNCVPHDVGCPDDEPWLAVNAYFVHDTAEWRDLNPKFVLQVFRDYYLTKDKLFLETLWPVLKEVMNHSMKHDKDGDGLIENSGAADQTFDGWCVEGPSAYCGGLWLAALRCMVEASRALDRPTDEKEFSATLEKATAAYDKHLWNGKYYDYDSSRHTSHDSVMADQCAGQWFLADCNIDDVLPKKNVLSSLKTIFDLNVLRYDGGRHGAVNGMRPNGTVDSSSVQSVEVWTGITYALSATMIHKGLVEEGFQTASGIYRACWQRYGMSYQTPEAFRKNRTFRSLAYMRPLSIWGMQHALENLNASEEKSEGACSSSV